MILALDVGLVLGYARGTPRRIDSAGACRFGMWPKTLTTAQRREVSLGAFRRFRGWVDPESLRGINRMVIEEPVIGVRIDGHLQRMVDAMYMHACAQATDLGLDLVRVAPGALKRRACGHGRAKDRDLKSAARALDPAASPLMTDHEAVARLLLHHYGDDTELQLTSQLAPRGLMCATPRA